MKLNYLVPIALLVSGALMIGCGARDDGNDDGDQASATTTVHVVERAKTDVLQHVGPANQEDSVGDVLAFANKLYDEQNQSKVGTDNGQCIRTAVGKAFECVWTAKLADGQLTVEGPFYDTKDSVLAITGGTGAYQEARGQMTLHARNAKGTKYDFIYEIVQP